MASNNKEFTAPTLNGVAGERMLSIDLSVACDLQCKSCFTDYGRQATDDMKRLGVEHKLLSLHEIDTIIGKAKELGFQSVLTAGQGEPSININRFWDFVEIINQYGMTPVVVTHGAWATQEDARRLWESNVTILGKLWSFDETLSRELLHDRRDRSYVDFRGVRMSEGIANIVEAYTSSEAIVQKGHKLALNTLINRSNLCEVVDILRWDRANNVLPYFEFLFSSGKAFDDKKFWLDEEGGRTLYKAPYTEVKLRESINQTIIAEDARLGFTYPIVKVQEQKAGQNVFNNAQTVFINPFGYRTSCIAIGVVLRDDDNIPIHAAREPERVLNVNVLPPCLTGNYACGADKYDRNERHKLPIM